jgi:subtilisin family serine protease
MATVYPDADLTGVVELASQLPGVTVMGAQADARFSRVRLRVDGGVLGDAAAALAAHGDVFWVDVEGRRELLNDTTIWVGQSGLDAGMTTPIFDHGIHGEGQIVGYIDTGIDPDMCYFRDTARGLPPTNACNGGTVADTAQRKVIAVDFLTGSECTGGIAANEWDTQGHGSHVAGTIAGDNFANLIAHDTGDGMAPGAKLVVQDAGFRTDNCGDLPGIGCPVVDLKPIFQQAFTQGARIHTNSWGDNENAGVQNNYTAASQDVDQFMFDHPDFLILFAAGNAGPGRGTVGSPSTAKNGIAVGATQRATAANSMASFSSCGPTTDGRIKPDLTMPGSSIVSARNDTNAASNNCATTTMSGTSMASPAAAGMAALVRQYYTDGFFPTGAAVATNRFTPTAALVKATLLNSTKTMTGTGTGPVPDTCQGWGRVLLDDALFFTGQARTLFIADDPGFTQGAAGQTKTFTIEVAAGQSLRATLAWTDFPSTPAASVNLNNDLDLTVSGPSGTFLGNVFSNSQSTTGGTPDRRNNVEQVAINAPAAGTYTITVTAFNVPSSAQPFALVATGGINVGGGGGGVETVFSDNFETDRGWTANPGGTDVAATGRWERANPETTTSGGITTQNGTTPSGSFDLVTAGAAGASAGANDVDGGVTSIQSPPITLPASGTLTLSLSSYFAHLNNSSNVDFFRVQVVGATTATVIDQLGAATTAAATFARQTADISAFAGQTIRIRIQAADNGGGSLVEAAVDDVLITRQ